MRVSEAENLNFGFGLGRALRSPSTNDSEGTAQEFESIVKIQGSRYDQKI